MHRLVAIVGMAAVVSLAVGCGADAPGVVQGGSPSASAEVSSPSVAAPSTPRPPAPTAPTPEPAPSPSAVPAVAVIKPENTTTHPVLAVSAGSQTCVIRLDRTIGCWGWSDVGPPSGTFTAIGTNDTVTCAIRTNGHLACWGTPADVATGILRVPAGHFTAISTDGLCAVRANRDLVCWSYWEGDSSDQYKVWTHPGPFVAAGGSCALRAGGTPFCPWLDAEAGDKPPTGKFSTIDGSCGIRLDGSLACWGGSGETSLAPPTGTFASLSVTPVGGCAIRADSAALACWGRFMDQSDEEYNPLPDPLPPSGAFASVSVGEGHACAMHLDGSVACWGRSDSAVVPLPSASIQLRAGVTAEPMNPAAARAYQQSTRIQLRWKGFPLFAPIGTYDIGYRWSGWDGTSSAGSLGDDSDEAIPWLHGTTSTSGTFEGKQGYTYCFEVTAVDRDGLRSDAGVSPCTAAPLDERALVVSDGWSRLAGSRYFAGTALKTAARGATLRLPGVSAPSIALLVTTCPTCGTVHVRYGGSEWMGPFSLHSAKTANRQVIRVYANDCEGDDACHGDLEIKVVSRGKPVIIDGVLISTQSYG